MRPKSILLMAIMLLTVFMLSAPMAHAATITVDTTADIVNSGNSDGYCSLREAVISANNDVAVDTCTAGSGDDTIVLGAGEYVLSIAGTGENASLTGDLDILNSVTIEGFGQAIVNADSIDRVFHLMGTITTKLNGLTITGGNPGNSGGGGVVVSGTASITNSTISGNSAGSGGGVVVSGIASIINSTISGNSAGSGGLGGGFFVTGIATIINSTISGNSAYHGGGVMCFDGSSVSMGGTILDGNISSGGYGPDCANQVATFNSLGYNMISDISSGGCLFSAIGDQTDTDALLLPLADNGGPTLTHALHPLSPAIDAGNPSCTGTDQRGIPRPLDGGSGSSVCDIGALEYSIANIGLVSTSVDMGMIAFGSSIENTITITNHGPNYLVMGLINGLDPLEPPFSIVNDTCSGLFITNGGTCDITVRFEPATYTAAATCIGGMGIVMLGMVLASGVSRRRKALASLLIGAVMVVGLLTACGTDTTTIISKGTFSDTFNIPSNDPDTPNITVNVSGSF
jgi:CSLREA domain-containing protein